MIREDVRDVPQMDQATRQRHLRRAVIASTIGTTIEWYDFFLYGSAAALIFPKLFFPSSDPFVGQILSSSTFFVGFVARPLGAALFGHFGDRVGRKALLVITMLTMGVATMAVGLVPSYQSIGVWSAILLTVFRGLQGLAVGGEWSGSILISSEWAPKNRRGFFTSFAQAGAPLGMMVANSRSRAWTASRPTNNSRRGVGVSHFSRASYWLASVFTFALAFWNRRCLPRSNQRGKSRAHPSWTSCVTTGAKWR